VIHESNNFHIKLKNILPYYYLSVTLYLKVLFMENKPEETLSDIRRIMERSSRFHSLSGFSLVSAGICGLLGVWWIYTIIIHHPFVVGKLYDQAVPGQAPINRLVIAALCILLVALLFAFLFTVLKERKMKLPIWNVVVRKVTVNFAIPMITGGILVLGMLYYHQFRFIATACLFFYGLALVNASHYTLKEIRYLGMFEILFGIICLFSGYELLSLAFGFGVMNILYGLTIWYKYREG
jgi:hypothetical protein